MKVFGPSRLKVTPERRDSVAHAFRGLANCASARARESEPSPLSTIRPLRFPTSSSRSLAP